MSRDQRIRRNQPVTQGEVNALPAGDLDLWTTDGTDMRLVWMGGNGCRGGCGCRGRVRGLERRVCEHRLNMGAAEPWSWIYCKNGRGDWGARTLAACVTKQGLVLSWWHSGQGAGSQT